MILLSSRSVSFSERRMSSTVDLVPSMDELDADSLRERFPVSITTVSGSRSLSMPSRRASSLEAPPIRDMDSLEHVQSNGRSCGWK